MKNCKTILLVILLALPALTGMGAGQEGETATTVILVRHAEKMTGEGDDPNLSAAGKERAELLARMLAKAPVRALYSTQYKRTSQTLEPLARDHDLKIEQVHSDATGELVQKIRARPRGGVVVVAGHSGSVPQIVNALGGGEFPPISEDDYQNLFIVTLTAKSAHALHLRFGE